MATMKSSPTPLEVHRLLDPVAAPHDSGELSRLARRRVIDRIGIGILVALALLIGLFHVFGSGPLWPDSPRYANGGAMIHDWLRSGDYRHPLDFAQANYAQYPGFSIPYHPPVYPGLLGLLFVVTGVSYFWARVLVAVCLALSGWFFFLISRRLEMGRLGSWVGALLLITLPEVACWSRDLMSEVPALMFLLAAALAFLVWVEKRQARYCWLMFALAELAFLSRVTIIGVLPAWPLYLLIRGRGRRLMLSRQAILALVLFVGFNYAWVRFALIFSAHENDAVTNAHPVFSYLTDNASYYQSRLPNMAGWGTLIAAIAGVLATARWGRPSLPGLFWFSWFLSFYVFNWLVPVHQEQRYFFFAMPALPGLVTCLFRWANPVPVWRLLAPALAGLGLVFNLFMISQFPPGLVGYDRVAEKLARLDKPGNVLMACWEDQELIFRYRANNPTAERSLIRGDRTLAIRVSAYTGVAPKVLAHDEEDVLDVIQRGRIRYVVTCSTPSVKWSGHTSEMVLADQTVRHNPDRFNLVDRFPIHVEYISEYGKTIDGEAFLWEYTGTLPPGKSELPVRVPTADLSFSH